MTTTMDTLLDRIGDTVADEVIPKVLAELTDEDRARIRAAAVERAIAAVKGSTDRHLARDLAARAEAEVFTALLKNPEVQAAITASAESMVAAAVETVQKATPDLKRAIVRRFEEVIRRGY